MTSATPGLLISDADGVRTLTLDRADRRNALDTALTAALLQALTDADGDSSVGAVVLAANGQVFCAGADVREFKDRPDPQAEMRRGELMLQLQLAMDEIEAPLVCALGASAFGAGASIAIAADLTVMGEGASLVWPETVHGMVPGSVVAQLQKRCSRKLAFELLALGERIGAADALRAGLVNRVVADAEVNTAAAQMARTLAARNREVMRGAKHVFNSIASLPLREALRAGRDAARTRQARAAATTTH